MLRPSHEEVLSGAARALALVVALALLTAGCAGPARDVAAPVPAPTPPVPSRNTAAVDDPADRARFACSVTVQRAQGFDPGLSLRDGSLLGAIIGGAAGAGLGALLGLIGDIPGRAAAAGAIVGGGAGIMAGGLLALGADRAAYERGVAACVAAGTAEPLPVTAGFVEYRLRTLSVWHEAFASFLGAAELADGMAGPGLIRLAGAADSGALERGIVLSDRHIAAVAAPEAQAFGATPVDARVKLGDGRRDYWDEARWYGTPGERTVWMITARNRRPQELRRVGLSDVTAIAHFRPARPPLFGARPEAAVAVSLDYLEHARQRGVVGTYVERALDRSRALAALVGRSDDAGFPDRVYLIVTHATSAATYEAVLAWGARGEERELPRSR